MEIVADGPTIYRSKHILRLNCTIYRRDGFLENAEHIHFLMSILPAEGGEGA